MMNHMKLNILVCLVLGLISLTIEAQEPFNKKKTIKEVKAQLKAERYSQAEDLLGKAMKAENKEAMEDRNVLVFR